MDQPEEESTHRLPIGKRRDPRARPGCRADRSSGRPIRNPATGDEHRVRIDSPNGIEFELAEIGSATTNARGAIALDLDDTYGQFNVLRHSGTGVVSARA